MCIPDRERFMGVFCNMFCILLDDYNPSAAETRLLFRKTTLTDVTDSLRSWKRSGLIWESLEKDWEV